MSNIETGKMGETLAVKFLKRSGYKILERNYRNKVGEIDIIAKVGDCIVFVEVKTRLSDAFGYPVEAVNAIKKQKIKGTALLYMKTFKTEPMVRFDVISIMINGKENQIQHIKDAIEG
ncbi:YraN family protein [Candidatus Magnetomonas plexicatena]|uniref:YraN family protein n=1 Tax=Candidatus Magnetomonas plexicatena TaxID=2552947 RepID=UPI001C752B33|nr:YraN family protein [Nitrospirales bacterium LBB_01]